ATIILRAVFRYRRFPVGDAFTQGDPECGRSVKRKHSLLTRGWSRLTTSHPRHSKRARNALPPCGARDHRARCVPAHPALSCPVSRLRPGKKLSYKVLLFGSTRLGACNCRLAVATGFVTAVWQH